MIFEASVVNDDAPDLANTIEAFIHCTRCIEELPMGTALAQWARLVVGFTSDGGIQIWCERHACNVAKLTFEMKGAENAPEV